MKRINALWAFLRNLYALITGQTLTLKQWNELAIKEIKSDDNIYYTAQNKHIDNPSDIECVNNYDEQGAIEGFRQRNSWRREKLWQKKLKNFIFSYKYFCISHSPQKGSPVK